MFFLILFSQAIQYKLPEIFCKSLEILLMLMYTFIFKVPVNDGIRCYTSLIISITF